MKIQPRTHRSGPTSRVRVLHLRADEQESDEDLVATEEPLELQVIVGGEGGHRARSIAVLMRTPGNDGELASGFLLTEGIIHGPADIVEVSRALPPDIEVPVLRMRTVPSEAQQANTVYVRLKDGSVVDWDAAQRYFYVTSSCGVCGRASLEALHAHGCAPLSEAGPKVDTGTIRSLPDRLRKAQRVFNRTGGLHAVGLFDAAGRLLTVREDVGRHNAMDKLIGRYLLDDALPLDGHVVVLSGRASWELLQKALFAGVPIVVAVGAPSSLAVDLAREFGLTLVGFARDEGFNVYAGEQRIAR